MSHPAIRVADLNDAAAIAAIYNHYISRTTVTFEEEPVSETEMAQRIADVGEVNLPWLVLTINEKVVGYSYATKWRARSAYRYSVESTVYLDQAFAGRGLGRALYSALLDVLRKDELHRVIGGIALPNEASVGLHETLGFRKVAHFTEVGKKFECWVDVGYWELNLAKLKDDE